VNAATTPPGIVFRDAMPGDGPIVAGFVRALAEYEKLAHLAVATDADFEAALFGPTPRAHALIVWDGGQPIGFALWYYIFSTFTGRPGMYLEDIFVVPQRRKAGIGRAIFRQLARRALDQGCTRLDWAVLDWNAPSIAFYRSIGAVGLDEWTIQRLTGDALTALAHG
jgi:GNAT superfamily N-acetyltransferase